MRKITRDEFDALPVVGGRRQCPGETDYAEIDVFGAGYSFGEGCFFGIGCSFGKRCSFGGWCSFGAGCCAVSPYWGYVYPPPFATTGRIYPPADARLYWEQRTGLRLAGCYDDIFEAVGPKVSALLKRNDWTDCERRILESWVPKKGE